MCPHTEYPPILVFQRFLHPSLKPETGANMRADRNVWHCKGLSPQIPSNCLYKPQACIRHYLGGGLPWATSLIKSHRVEKRV